MCYSGDLKSGEFELLGEKITYWLAQRSISLLEPIYQAQLNSIRVSRVKIMDEIPIKAGRSGPARSIRRVITGYEATTLIGKPDRAPGEAREPNCESGLEARKPFPQGVRI